MPNITCGYAKGLYKFCKLLLAIAIFSVVLYVFPPWKMKQVVQFVWKGLGYVGTIASAVSHSEEHASLIGRQMLKSGRDLWKAAAALEGNIANEVEQLPSITLG